jgi:hypothetical protein
VFDDTESLDSYDYDYCDLNNHFGLEYNLEDNELHSSHERDHTYESSTISQTTNKLLQLSAKLNYWSSKFIVKDGKQYIDVSSAARGRSSIIPESASQRIIQYPGTKYQFDNQIFHDTNRNDSDVNLDVVEDIFFNMINSPATVDGCKMIRKRTHKRMTCSRKITHTYICSHGMIAREMDDTQFAINNVGKMNVSVQHNKKHKSKGSLHGKIINYMNSFLF